VAVLGLGGIAEEHLLKLRRIEAVEVVGVCDLSETLVAAVCERFGVGPGFTDHRRMLAESAPDAVHVLTPPRTHRDLTLAALAAGAHVLVEKPAAPTFREYAEMRDAARDQGLLLIENYNYRFMPVVTRVLDMLAAGTLGRVLNVDVTMGIPLAGGAYADPDVPHFGHDLPGGALHNFVSHPASLVVAFVGPHERVRVARRTLISGFPGPDELRALITTGDGASAVLTVTGSAKRFGIGLCLQADGGTVEADLIEGRLHVDTGGSPLARITGGLRRGAGQLSASAGVVSRTLTSRHDYYEGIGHLLTAFYDAVRHGSAPPIPVAEMDATNLLVETLLDPENDR